MRERTMRAVVFDESGYVGFDQRPLRYVASECRPRPTSMVGASRRPVAR